MAMKRVLVFGMTENPGGVESFLMNYYRHIDRHRFQFDFLCNTRAQIAYEQEIRDLGGRIFKITPRKENLFKYRKELASIFRDHSGEWNTVWVNVCSLANIDYLKMAKKYGAVSYTHLAGIAEPGRGRVFREGAHPFHGRLGEPDLLPVGGAGTG